MKINLGNFESELIMIENKVKKKKNGHIYIRKDILFLYRPVPMLMIISNVL